MKTRRAKLDDAAAISGVLRDLGWFQWIDEEPESDTEARVSKALGMAAGDENQLALVAEDESGSVVGYAFVHCYPYMMLPAPEAYLSELFVLEASRGRGAGRMLVEGVEEFARSRGCSRLMLVTGNDRESYTRRFYQEAGWVERPYIANFIRPLDDRLNGTARS